MPTHLRLLMTGKEGHIFSITQAIHLTCFKVGIKALYRFSINVIEKTCLWSPVCSFCLSHHIGELKNGEKMPVNSVCLALFLDHIANGHSWIFITIPFSFQKLYLPEVWDWLLLLRWRRFFFQFRLNSNAAMLVLLFSFVTLLSFVRGLCMEIISFL